MSLATRCTSCGTVFRVVQDQLKVSEGWVRCGSCNEVFNAIETLFDLDHEAPPEWSPARQPEASAEPVDDGRVEASDGGAWGEERSAAETARPFHADETVAEFDARASEAPSHGDNLHEPAWTDERVHPIDTALAEPPAPELDGAQAEPGAAPEFLRQAERQARWQNPRTRKLLTLAAVLLAVLGAAQITHHFRDGIAGRWPSTQPLLAAWCGLADCHIEPPRRIEDISVESTALTRAGTPDAFRLAVTLRNRGGVTVALPSVDLSLTDTSGQLVARRALSPRDFRAASAVLQPNAEAALQLLLSTGSARVTGYTVEIFYP